MAKVARVNSGFVQYVDIMFSNQGVVRISKLGLVVFFLMHIVACAWFFQGKLHDFDRDSWVYRYGFIEE